MTVGSYRPADESALSKYLAPEVAFPPEAALHIVDMYSACQRTWHRDIVLPKEFISFCHKVTASAGCVNSVVSDLFSSVSWRRLQNVPWHTYPVLMDAAYRCSSVPEVQWVGAPFYTQDTFLLKDAIDQASVVIIHVPDGRMFSPRWNEMVAKILFVFEDSGRSAGILFADGTGSVRPGTLQELATLAKAAAWSRFEYSYAQNIAGIVAKPLKVIPPGPLVLGDLVASRRKEQAVLALEQPWALQFLYRLQEMGCARIASSALDFPSVFLPSDDEIHLQWSAGSKYPPARILAWKVWLSIIALDDYGLVKTTSGDAKVLGPESECELTSAGETFLSFLHPRCNDQDMLCRWSSRELAQQDEKAMDEWIMKFFKRMKTRVNALVF